MVAAASRKLIGELLLLVLKGVLQLRGDVESEPIVKYVLGYCDHWCDCMTI